MKTLAIAMMMLLMAATAMADGRNVEGSSVDFMSFDAATGELVLEICNASTDTEWHVSSTITLPSCLIVASASYEATAAEDYIFTGLGTNVVTIMDNDGGYGELYGNGLCMFVTLMLEDQCGDELVDLCYDWDFVGDDWGGEPHVINGNTCTGVVDTEAMSLDSIKSMYR